MWPGMMRETGIDFVFIDTEHVSLGRETVSWMCRIYAAVGLPPIVRIPSPDPFEACKILDGGADGIIAPYVESPEHVKALVGATKWRPLKGRRLQRLLEGAETPEPELAGYLRSRNEGTVCIVNVESVPAVENLDAILDVEELDAVFIGPHDLSCSMGLPEQYDHPRFNKAVIDIIERARAKGKGAGVHFSEGLEPQIEWGRAGANLMVHSSDFAVAGKGLKQDIGALRVALGDTREAGETGGVVI
jgi:4-hydroxy-2-oxoheptanedioate aldolase